MQNNREFIEKIREQSGMNKQSDVTKACAEQSKRVETSEVSPEKSTRWPGGRQIIGFALFVVFALWVLRDWVSLFFSFFVNAFAVKAGGDALLTFTTVVFFIACAASVCLAIALLFRLFAKASLTK